MERVIVIGLDGLEPKIVEPMLDAGELPHLGRLRAAGGFARVQTTFPAQTPVAWSTFATGTNPGGHGIFDFIRRDPATYLPDIALNRYERRTAFLPPRAVNLRRGETIWDVLSRADIPSTVIRCPCTYPPSSLRGRMLCGMGVPDVRGGFGTATFYSSATELKAQESENVVRVVAAGRGSIRTHLIGPRDPKTGADLQLDIDMETVPSAGKVVVRSEGEPQALEVREGEWSSWLRVKFKLGILQSVSGMVRFYLVRLNPIFELYASPINFDPEAPVFPISTPWEYAHELVKAIGTFYTAGMVEDHAGLTNGRIDEAAYLDQCNQVLREREQMMLYELDRFERGLFFILFDTPDRIQHMFWRFRERRHPANNGAFSEDMTRVIEDHYRRCDDIVGRALAYADEDTLCIVLSDHGFNSFQRGVHLNTWLLDHGFLALRSEARAATQAGELLRDVDWSRTKAYALGLGGIYLNLRGREAEGIVAAAEVEQVKAAIKHGLAGQVDPDRETVAIRSVVAREEVYRGPFVSEAPDVLVNFAPGYRSSWATALGGVPLGHFEDNVKKWGGDHIIDPRLVPGVLFMNRRFRGDKVSLVDLAPTILSALGVPKGQAMEGEALLA